MRVTLILIVVGKTRTVPKALKRAQEKGETKGRMETIQTTVF